MVSDKSKLLALAFVLTSLYSLNFSESQGALAASKHEHSSDCAVVEEHINKKPYQVSKMVVKARPEQVWQVLTDYSSATKIFPTLKKCKVLSDCGNTKRIHYQIHPSGVMTCFEYDLEVRETPNKSIEWRRLSGDFKELEGFWRLEPADCGRSTIVTYASHVNGGMFLPQALIKRQSRIDFPQVMTALKQHSESTTQIAARSHHGHSAN